MGGRRLVIDSQRAVCVLLLLFAVIHDVNAHAWLIVPGYPTCSSENKMT
jgi:hypothetical protein